jgi:3-oxosteroid 1-dehydrogenase
MNMDSTFDVVCVWSGAGGMGAALAAAAAGASVLVIEKGPRLGGTTAYSNGEIWVGANDLAKEAGMPDSPEETRKYLDYLSEGVASPQMRDNFIERSREALRFLRGCGVELQVVHGLADYYFGEVPGAVSEGRYLEAAPFEQKQLGELADLVLISPHETSWVTNDETVATAGEPIETMKLAAGHQERGELCGGAALIASLMKAGAERGVEFRTSSSAIRLITDDGRVTGVRVRGPSGDYVVRARRGVVLATGSYDHNDTFLKAFELHDDIKGLAPTTVTGDHIVLAGQVGAAVVKTRLPHVSPMFLGFHTPGNEDNGVPKYRYSMTSMAHSIIVNRRGLRYSQTWLAPHISTAINQTDENGETPNWPTWQILDQNFRDKFPLGDVPPGADLPEGMAATANTIRGLAEIAGIDPDGLEYTVDRWNKFCDRGVDEDFNRGTSPFEKAFFGGELGRIDRPPFVAVKQSRVSANIGSAGLHINTDAQAIRLTGEPIPGLFVTGMSAATTDIGARYQSGTGISRGITYGYVAAQKMLGVKLEVG